MTKWCKFDECPDCQSPVLLTFEQENYHYGVLKPKHCEVSDLFQSHETVVQGRIKPYYYVWGRSSNLREIIKGLLRRMERY